MGRISGFAESLKFKGSVNNAIPLTDEYKLNPDGTYVKDNIGAKIKTSIDLAGVDYYCDCVNGVYGAFHYTISLYAALVLYNNKDIGFELRKPIVDGLEQEFPFILKIWKEYQIQKESEGKALTEAELQLYNKHSIIRRHFQIEIPFFIANEFKRHIQGLAFTEVSFRYCNNEKEFYTLPEYLKTGLLPEKLPIARQGRSEILVNEIRLVYIVKKGDYLGKISKQYKLSISEIKKWNKLHSDNLSIGDKLILYISDEN